MVHEPQRRVSASWRSCGRSGQAARLRHLCSECRNFLTDVPATGRSDARWGAGQAAKGRECPRTSNISMQGEPGRWGRSPALTPSP